MWRDRGHSAHLLTGCAVPPCIICKGCALHVGNEDTKTKSPWSVAKFFVSVCVPLRRSTPQILRMSPARDVTRKNHEFRSLSCFLDLVMGSIDLLLTSSQNYVGIFARTFVSLRCCIKLIDWCLSSRRASSVHPSFGRRTCCWGSVALRANGLIGRSFLGAVAFLARQKYAIGADSKGSSP